MMSRKTEPKVAQSLLSFAAATDNCGGRHHRIYRPMRHRRLNLLLPLVVVLTIVLVVVFSPHGCAVLATSPDVIIRVTPNSVTRTRHLEPIDDPSSNDNDSSQEVVELYAKRALFGSRGDAKGILVHAPLYDEYMCEHFNGERNETVPPYPIGEHPTIFLVRRGLCTFERKAHAAMKYYGAQAILIYDSLSSRYRWNRTSEQVIYPQRGLDYDCDQGSGMVTNLNLDPPEYNGTELDQLLDMTNPSTSICNLTDGLKPCESQLCVVTSHVANSTDYPVCCAWDVPVTMPHSDDAVSMDTDGIVAVFLTIRQAEMIVKSTLLGGEATVSSLGGGPSIFNVSYIFMWMFGTFVTVFAAWYAASNYRRFGVKLAAYEAKKRAEQGNNNYNNRRRSSVVATRGSEVLSLDYANGSDITDDIETSLEDEGDGTTTGIINRSNKSVMSRTTLDNNDAESHDDPNDETRNKARSPRKSPKTKKLKGSDIIDDIEMSLEDEGDGTTIGIINKSSRSVMSRTSLDNNRAKDNDVPNDETRNKSRSPRKSPSTKKSKAKTNIHTQSPLNPPLVASSPKAKRSPQKSEKKTEKKKEKREKKKEPEVWSLHSLPPPVRGKKKNAVGGRPSHNSRSSEIVGAPPRNSTSTSTLSSQLLVMGASSSGDLGGTTTRTGNEDDDATVPPPRESATISSFEMNHWHVLIFIGVASLLLLLLFFFQFYSIIFVIYGIGCAGAVSYLVFNPLTLWAIPKFGDTWVEEFSKKVIWGYNGFDVTSQLIAYVWAVIWIWYGLTHYAPERNAFFWMTLDFFGACFCILAVSMLKINSVKIATLLMVAVFIYDIFFVFITPYLTGGDSVMLTVAGGGESTDDYCSKYPNDRDCKGINFLPMLLLLPKVNDYANKSIILGLGDIILPGFLLAFCSRYDEASRLLGAHMTETGIPVPTKWYHGYFFPMSVAYSCGLLLAFLAVLLMEQGQPALLYICPICLGVMFLMGRHHFKDLWSGAKVFTLADQLIVRNERKWGKARMKRFMEKRKRERAAMQIEDAAAVEDVSIRPSSAAPSESNVVIAAAGGEDPQEQPRPSDGGQRRPSGRGGPGRGGQRISRAHPGPGTTQRSRKSLVTNTGQVIDTVPSDEPPPGTPIEPSLTLVTNAGQVIDTVPTDEPPHGTPVERSLTLKPTLKDICFGDENHPGTIEFRRIVKMEATSRTGDEIDGRRGVFKSIGMKLKGRRFFKAGQSNEWVVANKVEIRTEVGKVYDFEVEQEQKEGSILN